MPSKHKLLTRVMVWLLICNFALTNLTYGHYDESTCYLRELRDAECGDAELIGLRQAQAEVERLFFAIQEEADSGTKQELQQQLEEAVHQLHSAIPDKEIEEIKKLGENINQRKATILDLFEKLSELIPLPLLQHIRGGAYWKLADGTFMNADQHNRELVRGATILLSDTEEVGYRHFNNKRDAGTPPLNRENFSKLRKEFHKIAEGDLFAYALTIALHDYGKLIAVPGHPEIGARLSRTLLARIVPDDLVTQITGDIEEHIVLFAISTGEYILAIDEEMRRRMLILQFLDSSSVGPGRMVDNFLSEMFVYLDNFDTFLTNWAKARLLRFLYPRQLEVVLRSDIDAAFQERVVNIDPDTWSEIEELGLTEEFLEFLNHRLKFGYSFNIHRQLEAPTLVKWLFMLFMIYKTSSNDITMILYNSDKTSEDIKSYVGTYSSIADIQGSIQPRALEPNKKVELFLGLPILKKEDRSLLVYTDEMTSRRSSSASERLPPPKAVVDGIGQEQRADRAKETVL